MLNGSATDVRAAYQHCERITRQQAKNFSYGIALLPGDKRRALSAVYAFARRIDDIGDGAWPAADKLTALERARAAVTSLGAGRAGGAIGSDVVLVALADAISRFPIPVSAFGELIDGCVADVRGTGYATFADLEHYCRCVAGSVGRLSLGVFGSTDLAAAAPLADALGIALQLTNILRDIREDLGNGRVYLPAEDLRRFGCTLASADSVGGEPAGDGLACLAGDGLLSGSLADLIRFEGQRARDWYAAGMRLMPFLDRRSAASAGAMAGIYLRLLEHICAAPQAALERRLSLPTSQKARVAASALAGMTKRPRPSQARNESGAASLPGGQP